MPTIQAGQQIYASVSKEQSPSKAGGFQTLYHTRALLTESECEEIEVRLLYYRSDDAQAEQSKYLFFATETGKVVLAMITNIAEGDTSQRAGRYLAHALTLDSAVFESLASSPIDIALQLPYCTTMEQALEVGDAVTGDAPPVMLEIPAASAEHQGPARNWPMDRQTALTRLALRASKMATDRSAIALVGTRTEIIAALQMAFRAVPAQKQLDCSFDTYFFKCNPVGNYFWAVGLPERPAQANFVVMDAATGRTELVSPEPADTLYEDWAIAKIQSGDTADLSRIKRDAFEICEMLEGRTSEITALNRAPAVAAEIFARFTEHAVERVHGAISERLPAELARRLTHWIAQQPQRAALIPWLATPITVDDLVKGLYAAYKSSRFQLPPSRELRELEALLHQQQDAALGMVLLCWTKEYEELQAYLSSLAKMEYKEAVELILKTGLAPPQALLVPEHSRVLVSVLVKFDHTYAALIPQTIVDLIDAGCQEDAARLAPLLAYSHDRQLRSLAKELSRRAGAAPSEILAVLDEAERRRQASSPLTWLRKMLGADRAADDDAGR